MKVHAGEGILGILNQILRQLDPVYHDRLVSDIDLNGLFQGLALAGTVGDLICELILPRCLKAVIFRQHRLLTVYGGKDLHRWQTAVASGSVFGRHEVFAQYIFGLSLTAKRNGGLFHLFQ